MNQPFQSSVTVALLFAALSLPVLNSAGHAEAVAPGSPISQTAEKKISSSQSESPSASAATQTTAQTPTAEVVKVGEYQSSETKTVEESIVAKVQAHEVSGRVAATLYVRNIPVLTFLGNRAIASADSKVGTVANSLETLSVKADVKVATTSKTGVFSASRSQNQMSTSAADSDDPVWRATEVAAQINHLTHNGVDANQITVSWEAGSNPLAAASDRYVIKAEGNPLVAIDDETILPDTTRDLAKDALQATNRLRRLLGSAPPLRDILGRPVRQEQTIAVGPVQFRISGWASWYGPGFNGNRSASGEIFNQNALTAAHRDLPFGTQVRVTNLDNGRSVVVRINDRGPYAYDRVIDLSAGAAQVLGLIQAGVAPVRLDILNSSKTASTYP